MSTGANPDVLAFWGIYVILSVLILIDVPSSLFLGMNNKVRVHSYLTFISVRFTASFVPRAI